MSSISIAGDTSGSIILQAPAVSGSTTLTLPTTSGTVLTTTSGQWITTGSDIYYNTGNVGIGTSTTSGRLNIVGGSLSTSTAGLSFASGLATGRLITDATNSLISAINGVFDSQSLELSQGSSSGWVSGITISGRNSSSSIPDAIALFTRSAERMRIDSAGNVGIGVTAPSSPLDIASTVSTGAISIQMTNKSTALNTTKYVGQSFRLTDSVGTGKDAAYIRCNPTDQDVINSNLIFYIRTSDINPTEKMRIDASGNLTITGATATKASGTTWANPSDIRLKDNVQDFAKGLTELLQVNVKTWEYNGKGGTTAGTKGIGVIADEIETVLPETVDTYKAKLNIDDTEEADIKRFDATEITWLLVKSIQEQQTIIETLKADIAELKAKAGK